MHTQDSNMASARHAGVPITNAVRHSGGFAAMVSTGNDVGPLIARLTLGLVIFPHGAQKLLGWFGGPGFSGEMEFFTGTLGIPWAFAFLATSPSRSAPSA